MAIEVLSSQQGEGATWPEREGRVWKRVMRVPAQMTPFLVQQQQQQVRRLTNRACHQKAVDHCRAAGRLHARMRDHRSQVQNVFVYSIMVDIIEF